MSVILVFHNLFWFFSMKIHLKKIKTNDKFHGKKFRFRRFRIRENMRWTRYRSERRQLKAGASTNDQQGRGAGLVGPFQPDASKALPETMKWASSKDPEMHRKFAKVLCKKLQDLVDKQEAVKVYAQRQKVWLFLASYWFMI